MPLLLEIAVPASADVRFMEWAIRLAPIVISAYVLFSGRSRESRKMLDKNIADLLMAKEMQQATNTAHQLAMEKIGDEMKRGHQEHEQKIGQLGELKTDVAVMKSQLGQQSDSLRDINAKIDRLLNQGGK